MNLDKSTIVRITDITINNFKNVIHGSVVLGKELNVYEETADIFGIYGQNGSGKTSVINAIAILQSLIQGEKLSDDVKDFINIDAQDMSIEADIFISCNSIKYLVSYNVTIEEFDGKALITKESLKFKKFSQDTDTWLGIKSLLEIDNLNDTIKPDIRFNQIRKEYDDKNDFIVNKKIAFKQQHSLIFANDFVNLINENLVEVDEDYKILDTLKRYAHFNLFVVDNSQAGLSSSNIILPINFKNYHSDGKDTSGVLPIELNHPTKFIEKIVNEIEHSLTSSNMVLSQIIPGFSVNLRRLGSEIDEDGDEVVLFELLSNRNNKLIPIRYESDGIKKIVSIVHLLIAMYNNPSITVVIDELDAGIFEYLLGELLEIIDERAKGQLIFTSHNLRPLEVLSYKNLIFSTTNPENRFISLKHVQQNNNVRDFYYRDIVLDGQDESLYEYTNTSQIAFAFRMAGEENR